MQNRNLVCPNCRDELPIEKWNKKLDYEDDRKFNANLMNEIKKLKNNKEENDLIEKNKNSKTIDKFKTI